MGNQLSSNTGDQPNDNRFNGGNISVQRHREILSELQRQNEWLKRSLRKAQDDFDKRSEESFKLAIGGAIGCALLLVATTGGLGYTIAKRNATIRNLQLATAGLKEKVTRAEHVLKTDLEASKRFGAQKLASDVLEVYDDLNRAVEHTPKLGSEADETLRHYVEGIPMIQQRLVSELNRHSVVEIPALGRLMDPHLHEAISVLPLPSDTAAEQQPRDVEQQDPQQVKGSEEQDGQVQKNQIAAVVQPGFMIHDRVLRPSKVVVYS